MISSFKENHPVIWRTAFVVLPFAAGVTTYLAFAATAPSYPQSIRNYLETKLQPLRDLPIVTRMLGPNSSTTQDSPIDTLMKHYAELKSEPIPTRIVRDSIPENPETTLVSAPIDSEGVTWNNTNTGDSTPSAPLDMGNELDGPLYQQAESADADTRIRALEALSDASGRQAVRACVEGLVDLDPAVRRHATRALQRADSRIVYREWVHVLQHGPIELLQAFDAEIPQLHVQLESEALAGLASGESDRMQKLAAIYTLGRIRSEAALSLLAGYAWSGDLELGQTATAAIAEIRSPAAIGALTDLTGHYDPDIRWYATNGLGLVKGEDALAALEAVIESGLEPLQEIRVLAVNHLGEARDTASIPTLVDAIGRYPGLRADAMYALSQITGIQYFEVPYQWTEWYSEWSTTPEAEAAERRRRPIPATQVAVMPAETFAPPAPTPMDEAVSQPVSPPPAAVIPETAIPDVAPEPAPPETAPAALPPEPEPERTTKPLKMKPTGSGGGFGTSDLTPAELMLRGGFGKSDE